MVLEYTKAWLQKLDGRIENFANHKNIMRNVMTIELIKTLLVLILSTYQDDDYYSYIEQAQTMRDTTLNYELISGRSGPVAYPALSSYLHYLFLNKNITDDGQYYYPPRVICSLAHLATMFFIVKIYQLAFKHKPEMVNIALLHSFSFIAVQAFSEKIFNDVYVVLFTVIAIYLFQKQQVFLACISVSLALGFKANAMIYFPAVLFLASKARGVWIGCIYVAMIFALQIVYAYPFLEEYGHEYLSRSYNFGRCYGHGHNFFWKFLHPVIIGTEAFNFTLLAIQLGLLLYFLFGRWISFKESFRLMGVWPLKLFPKYAPQDPYYVAEVFFLCNFIGMVCARGVFFQYMLWFWFSLPFLLWSGPMKLSDFSVKQLLFIF